MHSPLATLITDRLGRLGLSKQALAARVGYVNTNKGARRLQSLIEGRVAGQHGLLARVAVVLEISPETIVDAVRAGEAEKERVDRAAFVPTP